MENGAKKLIKLKNMRNMSNMSNFFAGPFVTAGLNQKGRAESSDKLYCIRVFVILFNTYFIFVAFDNTFSLSAHHYNKANVKTLEGKKKRLLDVKSG